MLQLCSPRRESRRMRAKPCLGFCLVQKLFRICSSVTASVRAAGGEGVAVFIAARAAASFLVLPANFDSRVV